MIEINEILGKVEQGKSHVYRCRGEDDRIYYVKGLCCGRESQVAEWVCANLARALGLPFPEFHIVGIPEELYELLPRQQKEVGTGPAFATVEVSPARWFDNPTANRIDPVLASKVLLFDYWIQNHDRYIQNTNLLFKTDDQSLVLIDHNLAFDPEFDTREFFDQHIFRAYHAHWTEDLANQAKFMGMLDNARTLLDQVLMQIPPAWKWSNIEMDIPATLDTDRISTILNRHLSLDFWRLS